MEIRKSVMEAREIQKTRYGAAGVPCNAMLTSSLIKRFCPLDDEAREFLRCALTRLRFSARVYHKVLKIGRTLSDLEGKHAIEKNHLLEALQYRVMDRYLPLHV